MGLTQSERCGRRIPCRSGGILAFKDGKDEVGGKLLTKLSFESCAEIHQGRRKRGRWESGRKRNKFFGRSDLSELDAGRLGKPIFNSGKCWQGDRIPPRRRTGGTLWTAEGVRRTLRPLKKADPGPGEYSARKMGVARTETSEDYAERVVSPPVLF